MGRVKAPHRFALDWYRTPHGRKLTRYTMVSAVAVPVSLAANALALSVFGWSPGWCGLFGASVGAVPSYYLNRTWAWGKTGRSHLLKEVLPFWALAVVGVAFSGWTESWAGHLVKRHHIGGLPKLVILEVAFVGAFGVLWIGKFVIFEKLMFGTPQQSQARGRPAPGRLGPGTGRPAPSTGRPGPGTGRPAPSTDSLPGCAKTTLS